MSESRAGPRHDPGARLVLLGRQGAGKGTQCVRLSRHYVVPHISTGDMLRSAVREGTEFGLRAKEVMDRASWCRTTSWAASCASGSTATTRAAAVHPRRLPRTVPQAELLRDITIDDPLDLVIDLVVPIPVVLERLAARRVCTDCGANYSVDKPPGLWLGLRQLRRRGRAAGRRHPRGHPEAPRPLRAGDRALIAFSPTSSCSEIDDLGRPGRGHGPAHRRHRRAALAGLARHAPLRRGPGQDAPGREGWWPRCTKCIRAALRPGTTTAALDRIGRDVIERPGARSNFLGYRGTVPGRHLRVTNDVIVHGIPGPYVLEEGDIVSIDCGAIVDAWHGDAAFTAGGGHLQPRGGGPHRGHRAVPGGGDQRHAARGAAVRHRGRRSRRWPSRPGSRS